jgi:hypothetical protein
MSMGTRSIVRLVALGALLSGGVVAPRAAQAEWPRFGRAITTAPLGQVHPAITTDGHDGAIISWQDSRSPLVNIFAQHVKASGELDPAWPLDGRALLADTVFLANSQGGQSPPVIVSDGAGGAIVAWQDDRSAITETDIFAQHVLASGALDDHWRTDGVAVLEFDGLQDQLVIASDGAGGAILAWRDTRAGSTNSDIFAEHVLSTGQLDLRWPDTGLPVCTAPGRQDSPVILADGAGGAIIAWNDARNPATGVDVFAQHVLNSGVVDRAWPVNGRALCTAGGDQELGTITSDGAAPPASASGAIIAWSDSRIIGTSHVFAEHVSGAGVVDPAWPANGRELSGASSIEVRPLVVSDGAGGAVVSWQALVTHVNLFAQHVTAAGVVDPRWPAGGRALSITARNQTHADIVPDGAGGAIVAWEDSANVYAQHVLAAGALDPQYPDTGLAVTNLPNQEGDVALVATSGFGAIATWTDTRNLGSTSPDIFAMQVQAVPPTAGAPPPVTLGIAFARPSPDPARGSLELRFILPSPMRARLTILDVSGRRVRELASGEQPAGEHALRWDLRDDRGGQVAAGLYLARFEAGGSVLTRKITAMN